MLLVVIRLFILLRLVLELGLLLRNFLLRLHAPLQLTETHMRYCDLVALQQQSDCDAEIVHEV